MKMILAAIALTIAAPAFAQTDPHAAHNAAEHAAHQKAEQAGHEGHAEGCCKEAEGKKMDCCKDADGDGKMDCCEKGAESGKTAGHDAHAGHAMKH